MDTRDPRSGLFLWRTSNSRVILVQMTTPGPSTPLGTASPDPESAWRTVGSGDSGQMARPTLESGEGVVTPCGGPNVGNRVSFDVAFLDARGIRGQLSIAPSELQNRLAREAVHALDHRPESSPAPATRRERPERFRVQFVVAHPP